MRFVLFAALLLVTLPASDAAEPKPLKVVAQIGYVDGDFAAPPIDFARKDREFVEPLVIRSAEELVAASSYRRSKDLAKERTSAEVQKQVENQLLKALKVEKIDWTKQMVIAVTDTAAYRTVPKWEIGGKADGDTLTVVVARKGGGGYGEYGSPAAVAIVERFDGKVGFEGALKKPPK